jgi:hypothetical protein
MRQVELYKFARGAVEWNKTSASTGSLYNGDLYQPAVMQRGELEDKEQIPKSRLEIQIDINDELCQTLLVSFTERAMSLSVFSFDAIGVTCIWKGRLIYVKPNGTTLKLTFENFYSSMRRMGLRAKYQKICRHNLYGSRCGVLQSSFEVAGTVTAISNSIVLTIAEASGASLGYYTGGVLEVSDGTLAFIVNNVGTEVTIQRPCDALLQEFEDFGTASVKIYPGCDKLRTTCITKFNNLLNFGGFPWIPSKNPMGTDSII